MTSQTTLAALRDARVVAIVRLPGVDDEQAVAIAETLVEGGLPVLEFSLVTGRALAAIAAVADQLGDRCVVGAGTVLDTRMAARAVDAGARFLVSPNTNPAVIGAAIERGVLPVPGAFTATELQVAVDAGAEAVKVFPAGPVGPGYVKALRGPYPTTSLVPTGGIGIEDTAAFLRAGATAVGLGSCLVGSADPSDGLRDRVAEVGRVLETVQTP